MKRKFSFSMVMLVVGWYWAKIASSVLNPIDDMPVPDFNHQYDPTIL